MTRFELKVCAVVVAIVFLHGVSAHGQPANVEVQELLGGDGATLVRSGGSPALDSETAVIGSGNAAVKKNVILIMADDFNHWLASVGYYPLAKTPNLDALAAKGVLFANTSSASPVCSSSRQALWSGLSPARTLIDTNVEPYIRDIPEYSDVLTMNQHFLQQGYYVYGGGKLYHSSRMGIGETDQKNWSDVYEGKTGAPEGEYYGWQGQANEGRIHWSASSAPVEDTDDTKLAMHMAEKISTYDQSENYDKPFFLAVGFYRPHLPWHAPKQFYDLYDPDKLEIPRGYIDNDLVDIVGARATDEHEEIVKESKWPEAIRAYLANLSYADYNVGIVLNALENSPYRDNTIVVFTGDHGYHLGEKERWKKSALYDQASRTTMITFDPGRTTNSGISNKAVSMLDLYPTIVSLAGLSVPQHVDGRNLERLLDSPNDPNWNFPILIRYSGVNVIKTNEWRFVDSGRRSQLYDMVNDPYELNNLYEDSSYSETVQILRQQLLALASGEEPPPQENLAPQIQINSPLTNSSYNSGTNVSLSGSASDAEDGNLGAQISWSSNLDGMLGTGVNISVSLTDGQHTITAGVTDSGGRSTSASIAISMTVNSAPVVVINAPVNNTSVEGDLVQFNGTASDAEDGDISNSISWTSNRDGDIGTGSSPSTSSLSVGLHSVSARVTDSAGDTATASVNLEVLQAAPPPPPPPPPPPTPPPAPVSTDSSGGGGALGGLSVMMLIGICVRRRRIGAYTSTEK